MLGIPASPTVQSAHTAVIPRPYEVNQLESVWGPVIKLAQNSPCLAIGTSAVH